jgi:hypothetical protein
VRRQALAEPLDRGLALLRWVLVEQPGEESTQEAQGIVHVRPPPPLDLDTVQLEVDVIPLEARIEMAQSCFRIFRLVVS